MTTPSAQRHRRGAQPSGDGVQARVTLLAAVARNGVIGVDGDLPWHLPEDLAFFKATTMGHPIVMGRTTFESIGRALPGRRTIVVTRSPTWRHDGVETASSLAAAIQLAAPHPGDAEVFVVGGGQVYAQAMPIADRLLLTEVDAEPRGDTYFPEVSTRTWVCVSRDVRDGFAFVEYRRADHRATPPLPEASGCTSR